MKEYLTSLYEDAPFVREVLATLAHSWPNCQLLRPDVLEREVEPSAVHLFIRTVQFLNDHGFISFDALLIGGNPQPHVVGACITRRGHHLHALIETVGPGD